MVSTKWRFPGTTNKTSPTYPLGRDLTLCRPTGASRRDHNCCGSCCESHPPLFSPLGLRLTIVLKHKGEIDIPDTLPCLLRIELAVLEGEEEYERWMRGGIGRKRRNKEAEAERGGVEGGEANKQSIKTFLLG